MCSTVLLPREKDKRMRPDVIKKKYQINFEEYNSYIDIFFVE